jgi:hypothetical protein
MTAIIRLLNQILNIEKDHKYTRRGKGKMGRSWGLDANILKFMGGSNFDPKCLL